MYLLGTNPAHSICMEKILTCCYGVVGAGLRGIYDAKISTAPCLMTLKAAIIKANASGSWIGRNTCSDTFPSLSKVKKGSRPLLFKGFSLLGILLT